MKRKAVSIPGSPTPDFSGLKKGDYIPMEELEKLIGCKPDSPENCIRWGVGQLKIRSDILYHFEQRNPPEYIVVKSEKMGLRILEDPEADKELQNRFEGGVYRIMKIHERQKLIDTSKFTDEQIQIHFRNIQVNAMQVEEILKARKKFGLGSPPAREIEEKEIEDAEEGKKKIG